MGATAREQGPNPARASNVEQCDQPDRFPRFPISRFSDFRFSEMAFSNLWIC